MNEPGADWDDGHQRDPFVEAEHDWRSRTPTEWFKLWFGVRESVDGVSYLVSGLVLATVKYLVEAGLIFATTQRVLGPLEFLDPSLANRQALLQGAPEWVPWALLAWQLPFVWAAFSTTVRRCANAGLSPWMGAFVLVPYVNVLFMLLMCLVPTATAALEREHHESRAVESYAVRTMAAVGAGLVTFLVMFGLAVLWLEDYGVTLFFATPLMMGAVNGFVHHRLDPEASGGGTVGNGCLLSVVCGLVLMVMAWEGAICILIAAPLVVPLVLVGSVIGWSMANFTSRTDHGMYPALLLLPVMAGVEANLAGPEPEYVVFSSVEVDAPPEMVWERVVAFTELPPPTESYFRAGIACPMRARLEGRGVGAVRYCEFTTGAFVEPITVWDEPRVLAFDVAEQPHPMFEVNPFGPVHPPHLEDMALESRRGEFRLVPLPGGRTRLEGRTWYTFDMHPRVYWTRWSDFFIHRVHVRVLRHVKTLAEADTLASR